MSLLIGLLALPTSPDLPDHVETGVFDRIGALGSDWRTRSAPYNLGRRRRSHDGHHMKPVVLLALAGAIGACSAVAAAQAPRFPKNMRYELARETLLASGWQPERSATPRVCARPDMCNDGQPEVVACETGGLDRCTALWRNGTTTIQITMWGRNPPMVERIECTGGCR